MLNEIRAQCLKAADNWSGCHWPTKHGSASLNLQEMSAAQAEFMSRATSGPEAKDWRSAAKWLRQVEKDARTASDKLRSTASCLAMGDVTGALERLEVACALEEKYRPATYQQILSEVIRLAISSPSKKIATMEIFTSASTSNSKSTSSVELS